MDNVPLLLQSSIVVKAMSNAKTQMPNKCQISNVINIIIENHAWHLVIWISFEICHEPCKVHD